LEKLFYSSVFPRAYDPDEGFSWKTEVIQAINDVAKKGC